jgi:hypothetical protein
MNPPDPKPPYTPPALEPHQWQVLTGVSLPIGAGLDPMTDFLSLEEQP